MKKLFLLGALGLIALVTVIVVKGDNVKAQGLDLFEHYKCYQARHAKRTPRFSSTTIFLSDQFEHNKETRVTSLSMFCSHSYQQIEYDGVSVASSYTDLTCYSIRDATRQPRFQRQDIVVRDKLTDWDDQVLTVSKAESFCTPAFKVKEPGKRELFTEGFKCYTARNAKRTPRFQQINVGIQDQFDAKDARVIRPVAYCSYVEKKLQAPNDVRDEVVTSICYVCVLKGGFWEDHISTTHATIDDTDPIISCKVDYDNSVWYYWSTPISASLMLSTEGSTYDTVVAVFEDNDPSDDVDLKEVACNDDTEKECRTIINGDTAGDPCCFVAMGAIAGGCCITGTQVSGCCESGQDTAGQDCEFLEANPWSTVQFNALEDHQYYILVGSSEGRGGKLKFFVDNKPNAEDCAYEGDAYDINTLYYEGDFTDLHYSTLDATTNFAGCNADPLLPACLNPSDDYDKSVWFAYTTPNEFQKVSFDTGDSDYSTIVAILDGIPGTVLDCGFGYVQRTLDPNTTYYILVGDVSDDRIGGKLKMTVEHRGGLPPNPTGLSAGGAQDQGVPDSLTCYDVRQARHRAETRLVEDQFSQMQLDYAPWGLSIGSVKRFCVPSNKTTCTGLVFPSGAAEAEAAQLCYD
jgi:hypothetical protein